MELSTTAGAAAPSAAPAAATAAPFGRGWRRLPRDARDTLFLLAVIGWTVLPHVGHLPPWCSALAGAVLLWRGRLALRQQPLPGRLVLAGVLLLALALTWWSHRTLLGKEAGVTLVVALMALKTLELRARRDAFVVFFLGFFLILTQFLYSQSMAAALSMGVSVWGLLTALVLAHMPSGVPALRQAAGTAARCAAYGAPVMVLLFVLFPRLGPLWGGPADGQAKTGLSTSMQMGSMVDLAVDDSVAMRLRFAGTPPPPQTLYFRGPVLTQFDGREWLPGPTGRDAAEIVIVTSGKATSFSYEATLEPSTITALPLLELAGEAPRIEGHAVRRGAAGLWRTERPLRERIRLVAEARLDARPGPVERTASLQPALELPAGANPRTLAWAAALSRRSRDADDFVGAVLAHIRQGGYSYTLSPGAYAEDGGLNAVDEFWLDRRQGFCEHYAAAFVVVLRAAGIPARVVTGYQGADPETVDGYTIVRQSNAHAWAEYWQPGRGWLRADPTAAVAPDRIVRSRRLAPPPGFVESALDGVSPALWPRLRQGWEAVNNRWDQWVLDYSRGRQLDLLRRLGIESPGWEDLARLLAGALTLAALAGAVWAGFDRWRQEPWLRHGEQLQRALRTIGIDAAAHDTPRALAFRVGQRHAGAGAALAGLLVELDAARYGPAAARRPDPRLMRALHREAGRLRPRGIAGRSAQQTH